MQAHASKVWAPTSPRHMMHSCITASRSRQSPPVVQPVNTYVKKVSRSGCLRIFCCKQNNHTATTKGRHASMHQTTLESTVNGETSDVQLVCPLRLQRWLLALTRLQRTAARCMPTRLSADVPVDQPATTPLDMTTHQLQTAKLWMAKQKPSTAGHVM
jgi:hypothetical protein